ncbi:MAG: dihydroxyacetone kinase subunit DhaL [Azospirillaceae bacterium]|nr:dihydroxyacetone kinase subunit DhaL [Azospirillaceae bacterium]
MTDTASTPLSTDALKAAVRAMAVAIIDHTEELSRLDQAIGDGDHGLNMKRGFEAILAKLDGSADAPPALLKSIGTTLVMTVGGASGPLYGSLALAMGKALGDQPLTLACAADLLDAGIQSVMSRGRSQAGEKTMLDTLVPVLAVVRAGGADLGDRVKAAAAAGAAATVPLRASKGRASFLGERSIGHMDPGARSSQLLIEALCDALSKDPAP